MDRPPPSPLEHRQDIDGLRALAVLPIVAFHIHSGLAPGGYVGVDIFYVISGYLITGILWRDLSAGRFGFAGFYVRRIRRILPALYVMLLGCLVAGAFAMTPLDLKNLAESGLKTLVFISNFHFSSNVGYFADAAELAPLLHTWSLAIEEQFYVAFPVFLLFASKLGRRWTILICAAAWLVSLGLSIHGIFGNQEKAFFMPHLRFWELLTGSLLALGAVPELPEAARKALGIVGLALVAAAMAFFNEATPFPGIAALAPVIGTALIILARGGPAGRLLATRPMVWIGLISYSVYLWHWPLVVFARYLLLRPFTGLEMAGLFAASLISGYLSWRYVEQPLRLRSGRTGAARVFAAAIAATVAIGIALAAIFETDGLPQRLPPDLIAIANVANEKYAHRRPCRNVGSAEVAKGHGCPLGVANRSPSFILWGDSHAAAISDSLDAAAREAGTTGLAFTMGSCPALLGMDHVERGRRVRCSTFNDAVLAWLKGAKTVRTVILFGRWSKYRDGRNFKNESGHDLMVLRDAKSRTVGRAENDPVFRRSLDRTLTALSALDLRIVLLGPTPEIGTNVPNALTLEGMFGRRIDFEPTRAEYAARQQAVLDYFDSLGRFPKLEIHLTEDLFCDAVRCHAARNGKPLFYDDDHLSRAGADLMIPLFKRILSEDTDSAEAGSH